MTLATGEIHMVQEALCYGVTRGDTDGLRTGFAQFKGIALSDTLPTRWVRERVVESLERFSCIARLSGLNTKQAQMMATFHLQSVLRAESKGEILVLFESASEMFGAMVAIHGNRVTATADFADCADYIQHRLQQPLTMKQLADHYGYHECYFSRKFKQHFGQTFRTYLLHARLNSAAIDLRETNQTILDISVNYCFCSQSHFQNAFRQQFGMTPRQYRMSVPQSA